MQQKVKSSKNEKNAEKGMVIERRFTSAGEDPFEKFDWIEMDAEIRNPDGSMADSITGVRLPSGYSGVRKGPSTEVSEEGGSTGISQKGTRGRCSSMATEERA